MRLELRGVEISGDGGGSARLPAPGVGRIGPYEVGIDWPDGAVPPQGVVWSVANRGDDARRPRHVRLVWRIVEPPDRLRWFAHGYQSWSRSSAVTFGVDRHPSRAEGSIGVTRDVYLGDPEPTRPEELRSELVTVVGPPGGPFLVVGFDSGATHDGVLRLRSGPDGPELVLEAFLGGAVLEAGAERPLHGTLAAEGDEPGALLEGWASTVGRANRALVDDAYQVGWCSWYHYFHDITEQALRDNLARAGDWPFDLYQLDDGYQSAIGDWLTTNDRFPSDLSTIASDITTAGFRPGLWLAPFLVAPDSQVARDHPDWLVAQPDGPEPFPSWLQPAWGGVMWGLDTTNPEVQDHLAGVAAALVDAGYTYLKLDFTFSPGLDGGFHDSTRTPAERVRAGYEAVRRGAGADTFLLGCGAPLGPCVGLVNGMRIGADVAPSWEFGDDWHLPGLVDVHPATRHAYRNTLTRAFQHRHLWLNDPDCLMLRVEQTDMSPEAVRTWAHTVAVSGGMALVSDDLALLDSDARSLLDEVLEIGRWCDDAARAGRPARCPDLLTHSTPSVLEAAGCRLDADPATAASNLYRPER